ncbi:hypothetical protein [Pelagimonas sp. KU-00592-HH]|uniref:calcium-binding protein n=1 Tax=Pelagimonas sp. KU-00592-HH TaxID=3127651 RepID=UPI0033416D46
MELFLLLGATLLGAGLLFLDDSDPATENAGDESVEDTVEEPPVVDEPDTPEPPQTIEVSDGTPAIGTDGDDIFTLLRPENVDPFDPYSHVTVEGGAGNDMIDLFDNEADRAWDGTVENDPGNTIQGTVDGGAGNDTIEAQGGVILGGDGDDVLTVFDDGGLVEGGDGNDTITGDVLGRTILGGNGDDDINVRASSSVVTIEGGEGNDTLYGAGNGGLVSGGVGNDVLLSSDGMVLDGGEGDDTLRAASLPIYTGSSGFNLTGGAGNDVAEVLISDHGEDSSGWTGALVARPDADTVRVRIGTIKDFAPGEDTLLLVPEIDDPDFALSDITVQELADDTKVTAYFVSGDETREMVISLANAKNVTAGDIVVQDSPGVVPRFL